MQQSITRPSKHQQKTTTADGTLTISLFGSPYNMMGIQPCRMIMVPNQLDRCPILQSRDWLALLALMPQWPCTYKHACGTDLQHGLNHKL